MDDSSQPAASPAPSPAKPTRGGFRGRGRGRGSRGGATLGRKTAVSKRGGNRGRGRGRYKTYDHPRAQAAYERHKELREFYLDVATAAKPLFEKLADQTLNQLIESPDAYTKVPEYAAIQNELDDRLETALQRAAAGDKEKTQLISRWYEQDNEVSQAKFMNGFDYVTDEFYDGVLNKLTILGELRGEEYPVDLTDTSYTYRQVPDDVAEDQGPYRLIRNGIEVPYPSLLQESKTSAIRGTLGRKKPGPKRKAEDAADGQPEFKRSSRLAPTRDDAVGEASTPRPRHIGGLLSAEHDPDGEPESKEPSPTPLEEGMSPGSSDSVSKRERELPELPAGASEPDQWGVRTVYKRGPRANNRLIIPPLYEFDKEDIGFRDSTNDSTRKATKNTRGRFLNQPNTRFWHIDQTIVNYNCLDNEEGSLDDELVEKHGLHPKYGLFLPQSTNDDPGPSFEEVNGTAPVVLVTPNGSTLPASRSVRVKLMDDAVKADRSRSRFSVLIDHLRKDFDIDLDDITTDEIRRRQMQEQERRMSSEPEEEEEEEEEEDTLLEEPYEAPPPLPPMDDVWTELTRQRNVVQLLGAARQIEEAEQKERQDAMIKKERSSRTYDAVRDVFGGVREPPMPRPVQHVDTLGLSVLADVSEAHQALRGLPEPVLAESPSMIDPRLMAGPRQAPPPLSSAGFLQTALNPTPAFTPIAPAPPPGALPLNPDGRPQTPAQRNPFTSQGAGRASPALPPLRPGRRDKAGLPVLEGQPPQPPPPTVLAAPLAQPQPLVPHNQDFDSPRALFPTNTGTFYPSTGHRPYHTFSAHEPAQMMPLPVQQGPPMPSPLIIPSQPAPPPQHVSPYSTRSPPMPTQPQLAPMPPRGGPSPPEMSQSQGPSGPPGPPGSGIMATSPPTSAGSRQRTPVGSTPGNGQANNAKYRKIAAAPIPYSRQWPSNGGSELRLSNYDPKGAIKDYTANEPPPRTGPTTIRGWSVNNGQRNRNRAGSRKEGSVEETESPK